MTHPSADRPPLHEEALRLGDSERLLLAHSASFAALEATDLRYFQNMTRADRSRLTDRWRLIARWLDPRTGPDDITIAPGPWVEVDGSPE